MEKTIKDGDAKKIKDTNCTLRTYKGPYSYGLYISNAEGPPEQTVQVYLKFNMTNY